MIKPAIGLHQFIHGVFARMPKGRVAQIMGQRNSLGQFLVQSQCIGQCARNLGHLNRMGQTRAKIIPFVFDEHLGFMFQTSKGRGVDDPIAIPMKGRAMGAFRF